MYYGYRPYPFFFRFFSFLSYLISIKIYFLPLFHKSLSLFPAEFPPFLIYNVTAYNSLIVIMDEKPSIV